MAFEQMTIKESLELTIELWEHLGQTEGHDKQIALLELYPCFERWVGVATGKLDVSSVWRRAPLYGCWACEYASHHRGFDPITKHKNELCSACPVWVNGDVCHDTGELYDRWWRAKDPDVRSVLSLKIAELARSRLYEVTKQRNEHK